MKVKINLESELTKKISIYLSETTIQKDNDNSLNFTVSFPNNLFQYDIKLTDLLAYLIWFFNTSLENELNNKENDDSYVK